MKQLLFFLLAPCLLPAQTPAYFQQEVNYTIHVSLDDKQHLLSGAVEFEYVNHAPQAMTEIWVHLWGNAFQSRKSAFCKQKLKGGNTRFYFSKETDRGYYNNLNFTVDGKTAAWKFDPKNPDIAVVTLAQPLQTGARIRVATPFALKIPASFSRLGHVGTSYQMTQWFPKPAVFDHKGWHAMPYLDMGEFYSEFGNFDVTITLPENYVVGATGVLQTPSEVAFLEKRHAETLKQLSKGFELKNDLFPDSSPNTKTIRYTAEQVHDFAWFADKRFWVLKDTAVLASGKTVDCWAMFDNSQADIWKKGAFYVKRAVEFYSKHVGEYPWPQATAVHSALSAGGGMEYPMITVIGDSGSGKDLDDVITHEVGHNWFYGILASNEREHPFMDEGMNSYYEARYMRTYYKEHVPAELPKKLFDPAKSGPLLENGYLFLALDRQDTPPDTHSNEFSEITYGLQVYMKTAMCMRWLEESVGTAKFDAAMQDYYKKWKFKHPYPEDFQAVMTENGVSASWFMQSMQTQKQADYAIAGISKKSDNQWEIKVKEKGDLKAPFPVSVVKNGEIRNTQWFWNFVPDSNQPNPSNVQTLTVQADSADAFIIDGEHLMLDVNRKNNLRRTSGAFPGMEPFQIRGLPLFQNIHRNTLGLFPWLGWNNYSKTMIGLAFYNSPLPPRKIQVFALPGYALGSKHFVGLADVRYRFYPGGLFRKVVLSVGAKTFDLDNSLSQTDPIRFYRIAPQIRAELRSGDYSFKHYLNLRTLFIGRETGVFDSNSEKWKRNVIHELRYEGEGKTMPNPFKYQIALEAQRKKGVFQGDDHYLRSTMEWQQKLFYKGGKKITYRLFAGFFIQNDQRNEVVNENAISLNPQGFNDYKFDHIYLARTGAEGILGRQVSRGEGGFKGAFGGSTSDFLLGNSNNFAFALNLKADLPFRLPLGLPLKPYFDIGYFDDAGPGNETRNSSNQWMWNGGFTLELLKGGFEIYFPLVSSEILQNHYKSQADGNYFKNITWSFKVNLTDPLSGIMDIVR
ncbi:MAG: M1 family metallopeptidase [Saprospiraceae bacterium]|nr:M1 family metallopeptidase [Saprospiraceae bacterium]